MATAALSATHHPATSRQDATRGERAKRAIRRRIRRIPGFLLVFALLIPVVIAALFGGNR
jgi:hypothetical protein